MQTNLSIKSKLVLAYGWGVGREGRNYQGKINKFTILIVVMVMSVCICQNVSNSML